MKDEGIQKYLDALETGDAALLEELAIKAGYVKRDDSLLRLHLAKIQLKTDCANIRCKVENDADISDSEWLAFCDSRKRFLKSIQSRIEIRTDYCPSLRPSLVTNIEMKKRWQSRVKILLLTMDVRIRQVCDLWTIGDFVRFRPGPAPFKRSFVSFIFSDVEFSGNDDRFLRNFVLNVYDENSSLWRNVWLTCSSAEYMRIADDVEANGPHEHARNRREFTNAILISHKSENLVYGRKAVEYLYARSQGQDPETFPLSKDGYEKLIEEQQRDVETWKAKSKHAHDPEYVKRALRKLKRWLKQEHGKFAITNWKNLNANESAELHECIALETADKTERILNKLIKRFRFAYAER